MTQKNQKKLIGFEEGAGMLNVSYWALWRGAEAGYFRTVYIGSRRMIPVEELDRIATHGFGGNRRRGRPRKSQPEPVAEER